MGLMAAKKTSIKKSFSAKERRARIDKAVSAAVKPKTKAKAKTTPNKTKPIRIDPKHAANRKAKIRAARDADLKAIAAKRKKK
jgi:hypothetical protein